mmetsp:Transcript_20/g.50  ORF Transcript_20/g.50 Transcript_20/m.50 type:complete len:103 (-) Transcript_20:613-921(-)
MSPNKSVKTTAATYNMRASSTNADANIGNALSRTSMIFFTLSLCKLDINARVRNPRMTNNVGYAHDMMMTNKSKNRHRESKKSIPFRSIERTNSMLNVVRNA